MFGFLRTTLAMMVMVYHTFLGILPLGTYAVFGFFIISGYLMTYIMHESYGFNAKGRVSFLINRFLRLHPLYWMAAIISILLITYLGSEIVFNFHKSMTLPEKAKSIFQNIFMFYPSWIPGSIHPRVVPPTWAITVEMFYYGLICLGISKTSQRVMIWMILSVIYVLYTFYFDQRWQVRYFHILAASLPFSIGSAIYFLSKSNRAHQLFLKLNLSSKVLFILMLINCAVWMLVPRIKTGSLHEIGFYLNVIICSFLVYSIAKGSEILKFSKNIDKWIGDFSYPIYLLHLQCAFIASFILYGKGVNFHRITTSSSLSFVLSLVIIVLLSYLLIIFIDKPIQKLRLKIKSNRKN